MFRRQRRYEDLQRKVTEMHAARVHCSVGELDGVAQVNENMKGKLELATASFKKVRSFGNSPGFTRFCSITYTDLQYKFEAVALVQSIER